MDNKSEGGQPKQQKEKERWWNTRKDNKIV